MTGGKTDLAPIKQIPILEVAKRLGIEVKGKQALCFGGHDNKSMSLTFYPNQNSWHCFGCGKHGDNITLVREVEEVDFSTALDWFADVFHVDVRNNTKRVYRRKVTATRKPLNQRRENGDSKDSEFVSDPELYKWFIDHCASVTQEKGCAYLESHGISKEVADEMEVKELRDPDRAFRSLVKQWGADRVFRSGIAWGKNGKPDRLIWTSYSLLFPFLHDGAVEYIQGRLFEGKMKFINLRGVTKPLYNVGILDGLEAGSIVHICEGIPDVLAMCAKGLAAVAVLGASSFRPEWVDLFIRHNVSLWPDGDKGGETFRRTVEGAFRKRGKAIAVNTMPRGKDVAEVIALMGEDE